MDYNYQNTFASFFRIVLASGMFFAGIGCDSIMPDEFKAKNFNPAEVDTVAGNMLTRDTVNDAQGNTISYQYYPITTTRFRILPVTWAYAASKSLESFASPSDTSDNQIIHSKFNTLIDSLVSLPSDSLILVKYPQANTKISYAVLKASSSKDIHIYTSLQYYLTPAASNINEYIAIDIIKNDTTLVSTSSMIPPEVAYSSSENILDISGASKTIPVINARYTAHLDQGVYIIRFTLSNPEAISNPLTQPASAFKLPSIARQFKVVILSF
jgi:hypothetical protein